MTATARQQPSKLDVATFLRFYDTRPDEEQWQLVDGVALLMTPPFVVHQRIASNLQWLLNEQFERDGAPFRAEQRVGIELLPDFPHCRPEPDVAVIDLELDPRRRHVDRFYLAAEVLSESDDERIELKRGFYRAHPHNRAILLISQNAHEVELDRRDAGGAWATEVLRGAEEWLRLAHFGLACRVGDLYRNVTI